MPNTSPEKVAKIRDLFPQYDKGELTTREIAEIVGVSTPTARGYLSRIARGLSIDDYLKPANGHYEQERQNSTYRRLNPKNRCVSDLIVKGLEELDITSSELARRVNISKQRMSYYATGKTMPPQDVFKKICQEFGIPYENLDQPLKRHYRIFDLRSV
ncbi:helix-turn-helix domain-containing protein [Candidatus Woesearchaeota archaeon]|nr:helix-turn-helix domain-containing protein [Candidatus Woesearchaeota archaeon]